MAQSMLNFELMTPEKNLYSGAVSAVYFPGLDGQLGVLPGHAPLVTKLGMGVIRCEVALGREIRFFCVGGFCEIIGSDIRILANIAEASDEIDEERARQAMERAQKRIFSYSPDVDYNRAVLSLQRSLERMQALGKRLR
ncbi:MAG: ATP synthase F1 subunit epsilon [Acidobacteria bacterium]|nr:ATP synthase F1 subunit epsilon [Acidobacteriota bacterium]